MAQATDKKKRTSHWRTLKAAIQISLVLAALGTVLVVRWWANRGELIRQKVIAQISQSAPHWDLQIEACRLDWLYRVRLEQVRLRPKGKAKRPLFLPQVIIDLDLEQLLRSGMVQVARIRLIRPQLEIARDASGRWDWQEFLPLPQLGGKALPEIQIERGTLTLHYQTVPEERPVTLVLTDLRATMLPVARRQVQVTAKFNTNTFGQVWIQNGLLDLDTGRFRVDGELPELRLGPELVDVAARLAPNIRQYLAKCQQVLQDRLARCQMPGRRLQNPLAAGRSDSLAAANTRPSSLPAALDAAPPPDAASSIATDSAASGASRANIGFPSGDTPAESVQAAAGRPAAWTLPVPDGSTSGHLLKASATTRVNFRLEKAEREAPLFYKVLFTLLDGTVRSAVVPYQFTSLSGKLYCDSQGLILRGVTLASGDLRVTLDGHVWWRSAEQSTELQLSVENLPCNQWLRSQLTTELQRMYDLVRPHGWWDVSAVASRQPDGTWRVSQLKAQLKNGSVCHVAFPYPIDAVQATVVQRDDRFEVSASGEASGRPVTVTGYVLRPGPDAEVRLDLHVTRLPLDDRFIAACQPEIQRVIRSLQLRGVLDADLTLFRPPGPNQRFSPTFTVHLTRGSLNYDRFPYQVDQLSGTVTYAEKTWRFYDVTGTHQSARLQASGVFTTAFGPGELHLKVDAKDVALDESLHTALPESLRRVWNRLRPTGRVTLTSTLDWIKGQPIVLQIEDAEVFEGRLELLDFPYPIHDIRASCSYRAGVVTVTSFRGRHGDTQLSTHGSLRFNQKGDWTLRMEDLSVKNLLPDLAFRQALPARLRGVCACLNPAKPVDVRGMLELRGTQRPTDPLTAAWDLETEFKGGHITVGLDYTDLVGSIRAKGTWDGYELEIFDGRIELAQATVLRHHLQDIRGPFYVKDRMLVIGSSRAVLPDTSDVPLPTDDHHVTARAIDGTIILDAVTTLEDDPTYRVRVLLKDGRLEKYAQQYLHSQRHLRGVMNGWLVLSGRGSDPRNVRGRGQLKIEPAELYELPVIMQIFNVLQLAPPDKTAFRYALFDFDVAEQQFHFNALYLDGTAISLRGRGTVDFNGRVRLDLYSQLPPRTHFPIPALNAFVHEATRGWVGIEVRGTIDAPVVRTKPVPNLDDALKSLLHSLPALGQPVLPPPPPPPRLRR